MGVLQVISFFPPCAGDEYKHHPSCYSSIALPVLEVSKMSVGFVCFTSSGSNGGCWVVLVPPPPPSLSLSLFFFFFFGKKGFFPLYATYA